MTVIDKGTHVIEVAGWLRAWLIQLAEGGTPNHVLVESVMWFLEFVERTNLGVSSRYDMVMVDWLRHAYIYYDAQDASAAQRAAALEHLYVLSKQIDAMGLQVSMPS